MPATKRITEKRRVTITSQRQFTIPQKFYTELGFEREAVCTMRDGALILEPVKPVSGGELSEQLLTEWISEGLSGNEMLTEFKARQAKVRPGTEFLLTSGRDEAGSYSSCEETPGVEEPASSDHEIPPGTKPEVPNAETRAALAEYDEMKRNPAAYPKYASFDELLCEVFDDV